jgi:hypothetical protein
MEYGGSSTAMSGRIRGEVRRFVDSMVERGLLAEGQPA